MPYREKTAWLSLIASVVTFGPYFAIVSTYRFPGPMPNFHLLALYAITALAQLVILGVGHLYLRSEAPQEARTPPDERDSSINRRAISYAYHVMMTGMILVGVIMPFQSQGWAIVNSAIFTIAAAEVVRYSTVVVSYRRQA